jgi:hypothetical protein
MGRADTFAKLIVPARASRHSRCTPDTAGWRGRLFAALLFAFYVNYIPAHLAAETHLDDAMASVADADLHHDDHADGDHHHDSNHHTPHRASDHTLTLTTAAKAPSAPAIALLFLPTIASVLVSEPEPQPPIPVFERIRPPGESPPDPLQPRAPPLS